MAGIVQRVQSVGIRGGSVVDLMSVGFARREEDVPLTEPAARNLLQKFRSLRGLATASRTDLESETGLDEFEILRAQALMELGRRIASAGKGPGEQIEGAEDIVAMFDHLRFEKREHFYAILLDAKNVVMRSAAIHIGTLTMSVVGPREVFREAIMEGAASLIVLHNHPSGDPTPSPEDIEVTRKLMEVGEILDIPVLDHIILGERKHTSLQAAGLMGARR